MMQGTFTALITPFRNDESFDRQAFAKLIEEQIAAGIEGIVAVGTTGESPTVTHEENIEIIRAAVECARGRTKVIAGTGSNSTREAITMTRQAAEAGADAALLVVPYYNKPSQEGLYRHFKAIAEAVPNLPLILYDVPGRTVIRLAPPTILRLAQIPNIVALKDATGGLETVSAIAGQLPQDFSILSGDDGMTLAMMRLGARGVISVVSNILPGKVKAMVDAALSGNFSKAEIIEKELTGLFKICFIESNPVPTKTMLALMGKCEEVFRLPLCPLAPENRQKVTEYIEAIRGGS